MADASEPLKSGDRSRLGDWLGAWQPFTGGGVAAFGRGSFARLFCFQLLTAAVSAGALLWSLQIAWIPVIETALTRLPERARVHHARLEWPDSEAVTLADSAQLGIGVTPLGGGEPNRTADLQLELDSRGIRVWGILGFHEWPYPAEADWQLGRLQASSLWAAWLWPLRILIGLATAAVWLVVWWFIEAISAPLLWLVAFIIRRDVSYGAAWRIAGASWLTTALIFDATLLAYSRRLFTLPLVVAGLALAVLVGLVWPLWGVIVSPMGRPSQTSVPEQNPFSKPELATQEKKTSIRSSEEGE